MIIRMGSGRHRVGLSQVLRGLLDRSGLGHLVYEEKLRNNWAALMEHR